MDKKLKNPHGCIFAAYVGFIGTWVVNLVKFLSDGLDVLHGVGVFLPPLSIVTVWF